jgi:serine/threonine protein kinase
VAFETGMRICKYELRRQLGVGGFGVVFVAWDAQLHRECAIKFLLSHHTGNPELLQRFLREARTAAQIKHLGIVTVFESGQVEGTHSPADGSAFIAMELLQGESLSARLRTARVLEPAIAIEIARQIASVLASAHASSIVHRDLKPDNVFLVPDRAAFLGERVKVLDFGIAKLAETDLSAPAKTGSQLIFGTPHYMSPEQCRSTAKVDARTDIYALGVMLFEMLAGQRPFEGEIGALIAMHQVDAPPTLRSVVPTAAEPLDRLVARMLAKAPADRPATMDDVIRELDELSPPASTQPRPVSARPQAIGVAATESPSAVAPTEAPSKAAVTAPAVGSSPPAKPTTTAADGALPRSSALSASAPPTASPSSPPGAPAASSAPSIEAPKRRPWLAIAAVTVGGAAVAVVALGRGSSEMIPDAASPRDVAPDMARPDAPELAVPPGMISIPEADIEMGSTEAEIDAALSWCKTLSKDCRRPHRAHQRRASRVAGRHARREAGEGLAVARRRRDRAGPHLRFPPRHRSLEQHDPRTARHGRPPRDQRHACRRPRVLSVARLRPPVRGAVGACGARPRAPAIPVG